MGWSPGLPPPSSRNITPGAGPAMTRTTAQYGSFHSAQQMLRVKQTHYFYTQKILYVSLLGILRSASKEDFVDFTIKIVETSLSLMRTKSQEDGSSLVTQHVFIFDLEGFSFGVSFVYDGSLSDQTIISLTGCNKH